MKKYIWVFVPLVLVLLLSGCAEMFEFNLFAGLDYVALPTLSELEDMEEEEALDLLEESLDSPGYVEELVDDEAALADVQQFLDDSKGTASTPAEQRFTALSADLALKTTGGDELVNNVGSLIDDFGTIADDPENFLGSFLESVVPEEMMSDQTKFNEMLAGFQSAWTDYDQLGANLDGDLPPEVNTGDVAQKALFAYVINEALTNLYPPPGGEEILWGIVQGGTPPVGGTFTDPTDNTSVSNLMDASGVSI